jgi:hypothetical protein
MIKWTDFALSEEFGAILSSELIEGLDYIAEDIKSGAVSPELRNRSIRKDAEDGMRIQETESESKPARMVGRPETDERKSYPYGRMPDSVRNSSGIGTGTGGGA